MIYLDSYEGFIGPCIIGATPSFIPFYIAHWSDAIAHSLLYFCYLPFSLLGEYEMVWATIAQSHFQYLSFSLFKRGEELSLS